MAKSLLWDETWPKPNDLFLFRTDNSWDFNITSCAVLPSLLDHYLNIYLTSSKINAQAFCSKSRTKIALKLQHGFTYFVTVSPQVRKKNHQIYSGSKAVLIPEEIKSYFYPLQGSSFEDGRRSSYLGARCAVWLSAEFFSSHSSRVNVSQLLPSANEVAQR